MLMELGQSGIHLTQLRPTALRPKDMCQHQGWGNHNGSFSKIYRKRCALDVPNCSQVAERAGNSSPPCSHSTGEQLLQPRVSQRSPAGPCSSGSWSITWVLSFLEVSQAHWGRLPAWLGVCAGTGWVWVPLSVTPIAITELSCGAECS